MHDFGLSEISSMICDMKRELCKVEPENQQISECSAEPR